MHIMHIMHIMHVTHILMGFVSHLSLGGLISIFNHLQAQGTSTSVVCHSSQLQLERLPVVPVGEKGTIPYDMRRESSDFPGASCDTSQNSGDGCK